jgi:hypothetical protein
MWKFSGGGKLGIKILQESEHVAWGCWCQAEDVDGAIPSTANELHGDVFYKSWSLLLILSKLMNWGYVEKYKTTVMCWYLFMYDTV